MFLPLVDAIWMVGIFLFSLMVLDRELRDPNPSVRRGVLSLLVFSVLLSGGMVLTTHLSQ